LLLLKGGLKGEGEAVEVLRVENETVF
jgi:hypothetical protein